MENWKKLMNKINVTVHINNNIEIGLLQACNSIHGNNHVLGEILFP